MPFTPGGAIEVLEQEPEYVYWNEPIDPTVLISRSWNLNPQKHYDMFRRVFGYPSPGNDENLVDALLPPLASHRGLPEDIGSIADMNYRGCNRVEGESWILWQELKALDLAEITSRTGREVLKGWWILFSIMESFAKFYGDDRVRLVVWWSK